MKKALSIILIFLFWSTSNSMAQVTDAGNFLLGTTLGFSSASSVITQSTSGGNTEEDRPSSAQLSIAPKVGYFLIDNFVLGIGMDYTFSRVQEPNKDNITDSDLLFGPFARYYFVVAKDMAFTLEANFGFGNATDVINLAGESRSQTTNIFAFGIGPGFTIISDDAIGISAQVKYNYAKSKFNTDLGGTQATLESLTNQFDFSVGLQFYFSRIKPATGG
jgi:hypothetical protein